MDSEATERKEQDQIWEAFMAFDYDQQGAIGVNELKKALERVGEVVSDD